jgi:amino acid adenylation domain-containing protein
MSAERIWYDSFREAAARWPDAPALDLGESQLCYAELARLADRAAAGLIAGCPAERGRPLRVGLCADRGLELYLGYLAIQRLGATAVPLSPRAPAARNTAIAQAARVDVTLTGAAAPVDAARLRTLPLARLLDAAAGKPETVPLPAPGQLAYILFTSGSTGTPKGVPVTHRNLAAFLGYAVPAYELAPGCRVSQTFELTFDPSVLDLLASWSAGATVVAPRKRELLIPAEYVRARGLTHWFSVPSIISLARRYRALPAGSMTGLRYSSFMGEPLTLDQAAAWREAATASVIENAFGPTELTVLCAAYRLPRDPADWPQTRNGTVPIGAVFPHLDSLVVDDNGRPSAEGELCVRGPQRFGGYLDPADNRGRFLRFDGAKAAEQADGSQVAAGDWYRTGDRVRDEDGALVHAGRLDRQLKLRGQRVELGEVEAVLRRCDAVTDAAVLAVDRGPGVTELHAVVVGTAGADAELDHAVREALPDYMRPLTYTWLPAMPLNANGKVDWRQVTDAAGVRAEAAR